MPDRLLTRLSTLNRTVVFLVALGVMLLGFFLPGSLGGLVLLVLAGLLAMLLARTWPVQQPADRIIRVLLIGLLVFVAVSKLDAGAA